MPMFECRFSIRLAHDTEIAPEFEAPPGTTVLLGPSGSGKTVTLRAVAGLVRPDVGRIRVGERDFFNSEEGVWLAPGDRAVGYVPQALGLYPHMTVVQNIAFGMRDGTRAQQRIDELLEMFDLGPLRDRRPRQISGGQRQRVALARALAREDVRLLLLDEPLSALDEALRGRLRREFVALRERVGFDALFVTHDIREAFMLADHLVLFEDGRVIRSGSRDEVFAHPGSRRAAELLGFANLLRGQLVERTDNRLTVLVNGVRLEAAVPPEHQYLRTGDLVDVAIRREEVLLHRTAPERPGGTNLVEMMIDQEIEYGTGSILRLTSSSAPFTIESDMPVRPYRVLRVFERGDWLVEIPPASLHVMHPDLSEG
ncbi:MAG: ABC transporter ATP-binding protein [Chloroflexi bacterium]|nr:ABC transporter ATP-binding protein [Chloroflexota bacterium]